MLDLATGLRLCAPTPTRALAMYRIFRVDGSGERYDDVPVAGQQLRGGEKFVDEVRSRIGETGPMSRAISLEDLAKQVAEEQGLLLSELLRRGQTPAAARARAIVAARASEEGGVSIARSARFLRRAPSRLAKGVARVRDGNYWGLPEFVTDRAPVATGEVR